MARTQQLVLVAALACVLLLVYVSKWQSETLPVPVDIAALKELRERYTVPQVVPASLFEPLVSGWRRQDQERTLGVAGGDGRGRGKKDSKKTTTTDKDGKEGEVMLRQQTPNKNHTQITVWWTDDQFNLRKSWVFVLRELLGDLPVPIRIELRKETSMFADANPNEYNIFVVRCSIFISRCETFANVTKTIAPSIGLKKYGLWIVDNEVDSVNPVWVPPEVNLVIHPYYFQRVFKDPRFLWIPTGYFIDRIGGGRHTYRPASFRSVPCWFMGSVKVLGKDHVPDGRDKFLAAMNRSAMAVQKPVCDIVLSKGFGQGLKGHQYAVKMMDVAFALCPGGYSVETLRVYEALENGAIPVLVQEDYDKGNFAVTHPHNPFVVVPTWDELDTILQQWFLPSRQYDLDQLQKRNLDWYHRFKAAVGDNARKFIMQHAFNNVFVPYYDGPF